MATTAARVVQGREGSYALLEEIGKGAYGRVYKGLWLQVGRHVAIKRVSRTRLSEDEKQALQTEILLMKNLKHNHIVNYIEAVDDPNSEYLDIVMEFVEGGSLYKIVHAVRRSRDSGLLIFDESVVANFVRQVVLGLRYLHQQGVVHRDIKAANILVTKESHVKLADFGVSSTKPADMSNPVEVVGSPYWMAPEVISLTGSSTASDIWSVGCTVIELLTGLPPYYEYSDVTALFRIVSDDCPPLPPDLSSECEDFLRACFNKDMHNRASADDLLIHRWLRTDEDDPNDDNSKAQVSTTSNELEQKENGNAITENQKSTPGISLATFQEEDEEDYDLDFGGEEDDEDANFPDSFADGEDTNDLNLNGSGFEDFSSTSDIKSDQPHVSNSRLSAKSTNTVPDSSPPVGGIQRLSLRDDPFKDLMDDPEADLERERLRKQKEMWEVLKKHTSHLGNSESIHLTACKALLKLFEANPEQRYYLIYDPGLLPILEVLESGGNGNTKCVEAMLQVTLAFFDDSQGENENGPNENGKEKVCNQQRKEKRTAYGYPRVTDVREDFCLAGFLPVVMRYCKRSESFETRKLSAKFLEKMMEWERALHMFIACRGFPAFVDMLEPDIVSAGELSQIALRGIDRILSLDNQRWKRDFCRGFARNGLLNRIVEGISWNMEYLGKLSRSWKSSRNQEMKSKLKAHVTQLAKLLQTFGARADPAVKAKMITKPVLHPMIQQVTNTLMPQEAVQSILCCVRDLTRDPQTHEALQAAGTIETLVKYLEIETSTGGTNRRYFIISSLHNLCIVSSSRQEAASKAGVIPLLQGYITSSDINLRALCIDVYSGLGYASHATRLELAKHNGVGFYIDLLELLAAPGTVHKWQSRVLRSLSEWLDDDEQTNQVEERLLAEEHRQRMAIAIARMQIVDIEGVLEPYLKMITVSQKVNKVFGATQELVSAMVRRLDGMYSPEELEEEEDSSLTVAGPRGRLLLLRTLLAHAKLWKAQDNAGLVLALTFLLEEVILKTDEAITVREQASLLLSALKQQIEI